MGWKSNENCVLLDSPMYSNVKASPSDKEVPGKVVKKAENRVGRILPHSFA